MDSGEFRDVIPIILKNLDLKSLVQLSKTCHFWKQLIYNNIRLWPKLLPLPYIGHMEGGYLGRYDIESVIEAKLWSMILPPEDPEALEKVLNKMASSQESIARFRFVEKVDFKNYIHTDESLRLVALLFPSIRQISFEGNLFTQFGIKYIAESCQQLKHIEFYQCKDLDMSKIFPLFNTKEHQMNLERILISNGRWYSSDGKIPMEHYLLFMALCQRCGLFFNKLNNKKKRLCLYHPGVYSGYGHSCSSYSCCGSNTPRYPSTLGCEYTYHTTVTDNSSNPDRIDELHEGHPEYMFKPFDYKMFPFQFTERRRV